MGTKQKLPQKTVNKYSHSFGNWCGRIRQGKLFENFKKTFGAPFYAGLNVGEKIREKTGMDKASKAENKSK